MTSSSTRALIDAISRLTRVQREAGAELARELDCPRASLGLLWLLEKRGEMTIGDVAHHLRVDLSVASRQTSALVEAGYAERCVPATPHTDRRVRTVRLSETGHRFTVTAREKLDGLLVDLFAEWTAEDVRRAATQIDRITDVMAGRLGQHAEDGDDLLIDAESPHDAAGPPLDAGPPPPAPEPAAAPRALAGTV